MSFDGSLNWSVDHYRPTTTKSAAGAMVNTLEKMGAIRCRFREIGGGEKEIIGREGVKLTHVFLMGPDEDILSKDEFWFHIDEDDDGDARYQKFKVDNPTERRGMGDLHHLEVLTWMIEPK